MSKKKKLLQNDQPVTGATNGSIVDMDCFVGPSYRTCVTINVRNENGVISSINYGYSNGEQTQQSASSIVASSAESKKEKKKKAIIPDEIIDESIFAAETPVAEKAAEKVAEETVEKVEKKREKKANKPEKQLVEGIPVSKVRDRKRGIFLFLIALLTLVIIAMAVSYFVEVPFLTDNLSIFTIKGTGDNPDTQITLVDPIIGMFKCAFKDISWKSEFYNRYLVGRVEDNIVMTAISLYATPIAALLVVFFAVIAFFKALVALFTPRKNGLFYKKIGFGFLSIATFLCGAIMLIGGMYAAQVEFSNFPGYLTFDCPYIQLNYGLYAILAISILTFIFSCVSYSKKTKIRK